MRSKILMTTIDLERVKGIEDLTILLKSMLPEEVVYLF